jgi:hypothetical protein
MAYNWTYKSSTKHIGMSGKMPRLKIRKGIKNRVACRR